MSFLSIEFWAIFPLFFWMYWLFAARPKVQNTLLLLASYGILLCLDERFAVCIALYTVGVYIFSLLIHRNPDNRFFFAFSILFSLSCLGLFKYHEFFRDTAQEFFEKVGMPVSIPGLELIVPLGISFYTFHSISYLASIRKREIDPVAFQDFALFLAFFPSLVSGPINRARDFLPQIQVVQPRAPLDPCRAFVLLLLALAKVMWLGGALLDNWVKPVFGNPLEFHSLDILLAAYAYAVQLYLNFSGYTDLVTAIALFLGFRLPVNFDAPYLAVNIQDFWRRWHVSLSLFMRDYVYIPLGGSREGMARSLRNLMITMLVSGLWHGASFTFLLWGAIHGAGMVLHRLARDFAGRPLVTNKTLAAALTFHFVCFAWIFFRCPSLADSLNFLSALCENLDVPLRFNACFYLGVFVFVFIVYPWVSRFPEEAARKLRAVPWGFRPFILALFAWVFITLSPPGVPEFIYAGF